MNKLLLSLVFLVALVSPTAHGISVAQSHSDSGWISQEDPQSGQLVQTMELTLHPQAEHKPALELRLIPDEYELKDGNAAIYYLRAMGFLEQNNARDKRSEVWSQAQQRAQDEGKEVADVPPYVWLEMEPRDLPLEEVKEYLALTSFQARDLELARQTRSFSLERDIKNASNPMAILLPEVQSMRELARTQSLRCRVAIAEERFEDAFQILGQQFALAHHLSHDPFIVSGLVGAAIEAIAGTDALHVLQMPNAKNMYWALATLPEPLINVRNALAIEGRFAQLQFKGLSEVDQRTRPTGYWQDLTERMLSEVQSLIGTLNLYNSNVEQPEFNRALFVSAIAAAYPGAKRYLLEEIELERELVESFPTAQTVFLAAKYFHERASDEHFKWYFVEYAAAKDNPQFKSVNDEFARATRELGWASTPAALMLPATEAYLAALQRVELQIAMLQTVEAIRMYGAANAGTLPKALADLPLPAPDDPFTGKPLEYQFDGETASLSATANNISYRLILRFADAR